MYTLVSASVLALDLSRHPFGAAVADVVDRALAAADLPPGQAAGDRTGARRRVLDLSDRALGVGQALRSFSAAAGTGFAAPEVQAASRQLQAALLGRLDDLLHVLQQHLAEDRGLDQEVVDVVLDRVAAAWGADAPAADVALLRSPWDAAVEPLLPAAPPELGAPRLMGLLEQVARCDADRWARLDAAHERWHSGTSWSELVHEATRRTVEHGRTVDAARWQLSAARAAHAAGHTMTTCTPGAMMSVVGAVQALCAEDVLTASAASRLLRPCRDVLLAH